VKTAIALLAMILLSGCREVHPAKSESVQKAPPPKDTSEILIQHLVRRVSDLTEEIDKRGNEIVEHDNKCLEEQIAVLEGRPVHQGQSNQLADAKALADSLNASLGRAVQNLLDSEEATAEHNRRYPESPWAEGKDLLRLMCGDCTKERAVRDLQLKEEAQRRESPTATRTSSPH
jgi:hypothetical protein